MSFNKGDTVIYTASVNGVADNLTNGHEYTVQRDSCGQWVPLIGDDNLYCYGNASCLDVKRAPYKIGTLAQATAAVTAVLTASYSIGDWVFITDADNRQDLTAGKPYQVVRVMLTAIEIIDDDGDEHAINTDNVTLTVTDEEEGAYEEAKANARVTSTGLFERGDVLVYLDGTPTLTSLTVSWCTATAVCFEETYSMPFNPAEFRRECQ